MSKPDRKAIELRIQQARTRGEQKRLGAWLDEQDDVTRKMVWDIARERGEDLPVEAMEWPGKRLVRRARARQVSARERKNPIRVDEAFDCVVCGMSVPLGGARVRDHCPSCLHSLHVDRVPGDRASECRGVLVPVGLEMVGGEAVVRYLCDRCGHTHRCRSHEDDSQEALQVLGAMDDTQRSLRLQAVGLPGRVEKFCNDNALLEGRLAVAVSGGVDSMTLLHVLVALGHRPLVLSVDHGLRSEAKQEFAAVEREAEQLGLPFQGCVLAVEPGADLARRARDARYGFFDTVEVDTVAIGHHRDDQLETVMDRFIRGGSSGGLSGIPVRRGRYVRPLIRESRAHIEAWAQMKGIQHFEDPSNRKGTRGRIRHELLPLIKDLRQGASQSILRSAEKLREDDEYLMGEAHALLEADGLLLAAYDAAPKPIRRRAVLALIKRARGHADGVASIHLDQVERLSRDGQWNPLPGGFRLVRGDRFLMCLPAPPEPCSMAEGTWGLWTIRSSAELTVRPIQKGEEGGDVGLRERLRQAGVCVALRDYYPVIEGQYRRWLPGVWLEASEESQGVRVQCECRHFATILTGDPQSAEL